MVTTRSARSGGKKESETKGVKDNNIIESKAKKVIKAPVNSKRSIRSKKESEPKIEVTKERRNSKRVIGVKKVPTSGLLGWLGKNIPKKSDLNAKVETNDNKKSEVKKFDNKTKLVKKESNDDIIDSIVSIKPNKKAKIESIKLEKENQAIESESDIEPEISSYEQKRLETIRQNQELMLKLSLGLGGLSTTSLLPPKPKSTKRVLVPKIQYEGQLRQSRRIKGIKPDQFGLATLKRFNLDIPSDLVKLDQDDIVNEIKNEPYVPRHIKVDTEFHVDDKFTEMVTNLIQTNNNQIKLGSFVEEYISDINDLKLSDKIKGMRCISNGLTKATKERIYTMAVHPDPNNILVSIGSKVGELALWDASHHLRAHLNRDLDNTNGSGYGYGTTLEEDNLIRFQPHSQAITGMKYQPSDPKNLITCSYDGTIKQINLITQQIQSNLSTSHPGITNMDISANVPNQVIFCTWDGELGTHDLRTKHSQIFKLNNNNKKIGSISIHPTRNDLIATGSLDRTLKLWDMRKIKKGGEINWLSETKMDLSVTSAYFSPSGQNLVTTSYENKLRVFDLSELLTSYPEPIPTLQQQTYSNHNTRSGRYVTLLRAQFHPDPLIGNKLVTVADMSRAVHFYSATTGKALVKLSDKSLMTAVPAVIAYHPLARLVSDEGVGSALVAGNASGKAFILM